MIHQCYNDANMAGVERMYDLHDASELSAFFVVLAHLDLHSSSKDCILLMLSFVLWCDISMIVI